MTTDRPLPADVREALDLMAAAIAGAVLAQQQEQQARLATLHHRQRLTDAGLRFLSRRREARDAC